MNFAFVATETEAGWRDWDGHNVEVDETGTVQLETDPLPAYVTPTPVTMELPEAVRAADVALDRCGALYVLSDSGDLFRYDRDRERVHYLPYHRPNADVGEPTALYVTGDRLYAAYGRPESEPRSDDKQGAIHSVALGRFQDGWIEATDVGGRSFDRPSRLVADERTRVVYALLERTGGDGGERSDGEDGPDKEERSGVVATVSPEGELTPVVEDLRRPRDVAVDRTGALYVLASVESGEESEGEDEPGEEDEPVPVVWRFDGDALRSRDEPLSPTPGEDELLWVRFDGEPIDDPARIDVVDKAELLVGLGPETDSEAVLFRFRRREPVEGDPSDGPAYDAERLPSVRWSCHRLLLARGPTKGRRLGLYAIDGARRRVHFLEEATRHRRAAPTGEDGDRRRSEYTARLIERFDSGVAEMHWHRVTLGLDGLGQSSQVRLRYHATDEPEPVGDVEDVDRIGRTYGERLREDDVDSVSKLIRLDPGHIADVTDAWPGDARRMHEDARNRFDRWWRAAGQELPRPDPRDALLSGAVGRYLWVELELTGSEFTSPRVDTFRAYFPRQSYLRHLPAVYREDRASAAFLERFLSLFESVFVEVEEELESFTRLLDPGGAPAPYLAWLGRWLAVETDETWSEEATREFIANAPALFEARGTRPGLLDLLRIYLEVDAGSNGGDSTDAGYEVGVGPYLLEHRELDRVESEELRAAYERFLDCPRCFLVLVGPFVDAERARTVGRIVDAARPAHAVGRVVILRPVTTLGRHAYLGLNTVLFGEEFVLGRTGLGERSTLVERDYDGRTS